VFAVAAAVAAVCIVATALIAELARRSESCAFVAPAVVGVVLVVPEPDVEDEVVDVELLLLNLSPAQTGQLGMISMRRLRTVRKRNEKNDDCGFRCMK
jgi:hypothetical protein